MIPHLDTPGRPAGLTMKPIHLALALLALGPIAPGPPPCPAGDHAATGAEIVGLVRDRFFDGARAEAWTREHAGYALEIRDPGAFVDATRRALAGLNASHTSYHTPDDPEYHALLSIFHQSLRIPVEVDSVGLDVDPSGFARVVFAGSPAQAAGLRRGDQILRADGEAFGPIRSFRGRSGRAVTLSVRSRPDGPTREVAVVPRRVEPRVEWLQAQEAGAKIVEVGRKKVAYMSLFSGGGDEYRDAVRDAILGPFAAADALILDLRDGWGGADPTFVNLFNPSPPVLESIGRDGAVTRYDPQWRKPLYLLINGGSRSGKEVVAFAVKKRKLGVLVGRTTAGAVVSGGPFLLADRSLLYLAVADARVDGERLEGRGVAPDVEVDDPLPFAEGRDLALARALELAGS